MRINVHLRLFLLGFLLVVVIWGLFLFGALSACDRSGGFVVSPLDPFKVACLPDYGVCSDNVSFNISVEELFSG